MPLRENSAATNAGANGGAKTVSPTIFRNTGMEHKVVSRGTIGDEPDNWTALPGTDRMQERNAFCP